MYIIYITRFFLLFMAIVILSSCKTTQTVKDAIVSITNDNESDEVETANAETNGAEPLGAITLIMSKEAKNDLLPDTMCKEVIEDRDIWSRAVRYGGEAAKVRLRRLISSNFAHSALTESDKQLLRYIAYTTIWIPSDVEVAVGKMYLQATGAMNAEKNTRRIRRMLGNSQKGIEKLKKNIDGFPGDVTVTHNKDVKDGAFSRVGGLIIVSKTFLQKMDKHEEIEQVVLSHELSHLYKRHSLKELQLYLVMTAEGWEIAKIIFEQLEAKNSGFFASKLSDIQDLFQTGNLAKKLYDFVATQRLTYSQDQELEADACGLRWLAREGVSPLTAWETFEAMLQVGDEEGQTESSDYRLYHPTSKERAKNARAVIATIN